MRGGLGGASQQGAGGRLALLRGGPQDGGEPFDLRVEGATNLSETLCSIVVHIRRQLISEQYQMCLPSPVTVIRKVEIYLEIKPSVSREIEYGQ